MMLVTEGLAFSVARGSAWPLRVFGCCSHEKYPFFVSTAPVNGDEWHEAKGVASLVSIPQLSQLPCPTKRLDLRTPPRSKSPTCSQRTRRSGISTATTWPGTTFYLANLVGSDLQKLRSKQPFDLIFRESQTPALRVYVAKASKCCGLDVSPLRKNFSETLGSNLLLLGAKGCPDRGPTLWTCFG